MISECIYVILNITNRSILFFCVFACVFLVVSEKCYLLSGRSVSGKIVPEVLTTSTLGRVDSFSQYGPTLAGE